MTLTKQGGNTFFFKKRSDLIILVKVRVSCKLSLTSLVTSASSTLLLGRKLHLLRLFSLAASRIFLYSCPRVFFQVWLWYIFFFFLYFSSLLLLLLFSYLQFFSFSLPKFLLQSFYALFVLVIVINELLSFGSLFLLLTIY